MSAVVHKRTRTYLLSYLLFRSSVERTPRVLARRCQAPPQQPGRGRAGQGMQRGHSSSTEAKHATLHGCAGRLWATDACLCRRRAGATIAGTLGECLRGTNRWALDRRASRIRTRSPDGAVGAVGGCQVAAARVPREHLHRGVKALQQQRRRRGAAVGGCRQGAQVPAAHLQGQAERGAEIDGSVSAAG